MDAILVPGGFGDRGVEGKITAVRYARENNIPFLGICLGMHVALVEYARNVCGLEGARLHRNEPTTPHPIVALITEWQNADGSTEQRDEISDLGGTMRLGAQPCHLEAGSKVREIYGEDTVRSAIDTVMKLTIITWNSCRMPACESLAGRPIIRWWR